MKNVVDFIIYIYTLLLRLCFRFIPFNQIFLDTIRAIVLDTREPIAHRWVVDEIDFYVKIVYSFNINFIVFMNSGKVFRYVVQFLAIFQSLQLWQVPLVCWCKEILCQVRKLCDIWDFDLIFIELIELIEFEFWLMILFSNLMVSTEVSWWNILNLKIYTTLSETI